MTQAPMILEQCHSSLDILGQIQPAVRGIDIQHLDIQTWGEGTMAFEMNKDLDGEVNIVIWTLPLGGMRRGYKAIGVKG
jgi:hypothetical protein